MTKKDYELLVEVVADVRRLSSVEAIPTLSLLLKLLCVTLKRDNPLFSEQKFRKAYENGYFRGKKGPLGQGPV